jgi:hypothetical protein
MVLLQPFPGGNVSQAFGINDLGLIVGASLNAVISGDQRAIVWENGTPLDLQPRLQGADGWTLHYAIGITNDGVILAAATNAADAVPGPGLTVSHLVLLTPVQNNVEKYYAWRYQISRYYQAKQDRWRKQIAQYYSRGIGR